MPRRPRRPRALLASLALPAAAFAAPGGVDAQAGGSAPAPVVAPADFRAAVAGATRGADGRPGARYWQQRADYVIEARLDPASGRVTGSETITYANRSPDTLRSVLLHLEQNVFAPGARRNRRAPVTGGIEVSGLRVDGRPVEGRHPGRGYYEALTLLEVPLPAPLPPGGRTTVEASWSFTVPPAPTFRTGNLDGEVFAVAQWYPRVAVYDDVDGWDATLYLGDGEFYLEYGDFDVSLTVPEGWLVGATGTLRNPQEVLSPEAARRLALAQRVDTVVRVVDSPMLEAGRATADASGGWLTWRFTAEDVRDVAFAASDAWVWDAVRVAATDAGRPAGEEPALAMALYRPRFGAWREAARYAAFTVERMSDWIGPYRYPRLTITEGPVGGMEYPMLVFNPSTDDPRALASVTIHESAHQWFPMMVGSHEARYAWMDEGFVSHFDELALAELLGEAPPRWGETGSYLRVAGTEDEVPLMRPTDLVSPYGARTLAAYTKPAVVLGALRGVVGDSVFAAAFRDYFASWQLRHPRPWDFFATVERHAGRDLDWFWRPLFYETDVLDHAVAGVEKDGGGSTVVLRSLGGVVLPTPLELTMADGTVRREWVPAETWLAVGREHRLAVPGDVQRVVLDPGGRFPDVDRSNNAWEGSAGGG